MTDFSETIAAARRCLGPRVDGAKLLRAWREPHRGYHGAGHLAELEALILAAHPRGDWRDLLLAVALLHDAVYHPRRGDNEVRSAKLVDLFADDREGEAAEAVRTAILETRYHARAKSPLGLAFAAYDLHSLAMGREAQIAVHAAVYREYQYATAPAFRAGRAEALQAVAAAYPEYAEGIAAAIESLADFRPEVAAVRLEAIPSAATWGELCAKSAKFSKLLLVCRDRALRDRAAALFCLNEVRQTELSLAAVARQLVEDEQCGTVCLLAAERAGGGDAPASPEEAYRLEDWGGAV